MKRNIETAIAAADRAYAYISRADIPGSVYRQSLIESLRAVCLRLDNIKCYAATALILAREAETEIRRLEQENTPLDQAVPLGTLSGKIHDIIRIIENP